MTDMSIALSPFPAHARRLAALFAISTALLTASCSRESVPRPEADVGMSLSVPAEDSPDYGFQPRVENPVSAGENLYAQSSGEMACRLRLKRLGVVFSDLPPINDGGSCRIDNPVLVSGFAGGSINFQPAAKLNCAVTEAFARWVKGDLVPSTRLRYLSGVNTIYNAGGYSCRTMNHRRGAKMSEHSRGNAIDVTRIRLNNDKVVKVHKPGWFSFRERGLLNNVRAEACDYFTTVLGPGYNREHNDHFHFDLMRRNNGYRACK